MKQKRMMQSPISYVKYLILLFFVFLTSCNEWTPQAEGYFIINGKKYDIHVMVIITDDDDINPFINSIYMILEGAPAFNVSISVLAPGRTLVGGDYFLSKEYEPYALNFVEFLRGNTSEYITVSANSNGSGTMSVKINDGNYKLDFKGKIDSYNVEVHYSGLVAFRRL